jgi:ligand-binding sensor domain-containing protein/signal transduction histidine kinase
VFSRQLKPLSVRRGILVIFLFGRMGGLLHSGTGESERYLIDAWQSDEGLPQGSVIALVQSREGYLWAGTFSGLARFDGVRFQVFDQANTPELPGNAITALYEAHDGALLVCTARGGVAALRAGRFERVLEEQKEGDDIVAAVKDRDNGTVLCCLSGLLWRWANGRMTALCRTREPESLRFGPIHPGVLCEDGQGGLWTLGMRGRLLRLVGDKWEQRAQELSDASCQALARDTAGRLWLGTGRALAVLSNGRWAPVETPETPAPVDVDDAFACRDGGVWFVSWAGDRGVWWKLKEGRQVVSVGDFAPRKFGIYPLGEDSNGGLCLGSVANGFFRISTNGSVMHLDRRSGLAGNSVRCYLLDREGNEWLGLGDGGLLRLRPRTVGVLDKTPAASVAIHSICEDSKGVIWAGTSSEGLFLTEGAELRRIDIGENTGLRSVWSVFEDRRHNLWAGSFGDGLFRREGQRFVSAFDPALVARRVRAIYEDSRGRLWLGCRAGLACYEQGRVTVLPGPPGLGEFEVQCIAEDPQNRLWAGTRGKGLLCWKDGEWSVFHSADGLAHENITALHVDPEGTLWIGTAGGGLSRLRNGQWVNFSSRAGLPDDIICHVAEDRQGNLWFSSTRGVFRIAKKDFEAFAQGTSKIIPSTLYGRADGLPTRECTGGSQPSGWTAQDGRLLIPTIKGVAVVQPDTVTVNSNPPPVVIEELRVDGVRLEPGAQSAKLSGAFSLFAVSHPTPSLTIPPGKRRLGIRYTALSFTAPEKVRFKVRMEPLENEWVDMGTQREMDYSFVRPGHYRFRVIACNNDGVWNETGADLALVWLPHFWQTGWFTGLWVAGLTGSVAGTVGYSLRRRHRRRIEKMEQARALENERARIARDIHDDLGSSLTEIGLLGALAARESTPPTEARVQLLRIIDRTQELAQTLDETVWAVNPKNDWLGRLATYLCQFAKEFLEPTTIRCRLDVAPNFPEAPLSAEIRHNVFLVVKEALNNAVRHSGATEMLLRMSVIEGVFNLEIADNGRGFTVEASNETGNGVRNMARRMDQVGGNFELRSAPGAGTTICLRLPFLSADPKGPRSARAYPIG